MEKGLLEAALRRAGLHDEYMAIVVENPMVTKAAAAEVIRVCDAVQAAVTGSDVLVSKVYTGTANPDAIAFAVDRLGKRGGKLTITALADELKIARQNLNRAINNDPILRAAYNRAVTEAQRKRAGRRN